MWAYAEKVYSTILLRIFPQHKMGADRAETFQVVPSNEKNRTQDIGPAREIEVSLVVSVL